MNCCTTKSGILWLNASCLESEISWINKYVSPPMKYKSGPLHVQCAIGIRSMNLQKCSWGFLSLKANWMNACCWLNQWLITFWITQNEQMEYHKIISSWVTKKKDLNATIFLSFIHDNTAYGYRLQLDLSEDYFRKNWTFWSAVRKDLSSLIIWKRQLLTNE